MSGRRLSCEDHLEAGLPHLSKRQKPFHRDSDDVAHAITALTVYGLENGPQHESYTIAWVCALPIEMAAARAMLDDVHEIPITCGNDSNTYILGRIERHNIVVACLPNDQYGTNNAANVLTHLIRTFPSIRLGLMVGIGGGVPSLADIRLGDIVVGTRVMQYDLGKIVEDGEIRRTAIPKTPHPSFGTAVSALRAKHELKSSSVPSILREKLGEHSGYGRPGSPDRLFAATYQHVRMAPNCDECEESKLAPRKERASQDPRIHYGVIASGNQVMKSGTTRDNVARQLDAICFEMEAAGLMDILPCLPIRGICDYSDSHKNKEWQRYAAGTAAAYARELLELLPAAETPKASFVLSAREPEQNPPQNHRVRLLDSLRYEQIDSRKLTIKSAYAKTCRWFLNHPDYQAWLNPERLAETRGFLWIRGKPGAGKSTIMKFLYAQTKKKLGGARGVVASFFFNARGEQLEKSISGMYRSLLLQLLEGYPDLQAVFDDPDLVPRNQDGCPSLNVLKELFCHAVSNLGQRSFTCFVDALDECDEQQVRTMVQDLEELADKSTEMGISLRICFSSRHYPYIVVRRGIQLTLEDQPGHVEDLANYVRNRLEIRDAALVEELRLQILGKAAGVFLWVALVVDILNKENRRGRLALRKRLAELPSGLSELFKDMLKRDRENIEDLLLCILWILYAERPLKPEEYYHALWSGLYFKGLADDEVPKATGSDSADTINGFVIGSSKGLAEITKSKRPTVQFIHESVRDFLVKEKGLHELWPDLGFDWESPSHERLKQCCTTYMNHPAVGKFLRPPKVVSYIHQGRRVWEPSSDYTNKREDILGECPFLEYACQNVLIHANAAATAIPQDCFISKLPVPNLIRGINLFEKFEVRKYDESTGLLYILAERNLVNLIRIHPHRKRCFKVEANRYGPPFFAALAFGNHETVQEFLEIQARDQPAKPLIHDLCSQYSENENKRINLGRSFAFSRQKDCLHYLQQPDREILCAFLLCLDNIDIDIERKDPDDRTPLSRAVLLGHALVVRLLLEKNAKIDRQDGAGKTPLSHAAESGHEAVVRLLLSEGASIEGWHDGQTPLWYAAGSGHEAVVQLLIEKGANLESRGPTNQAPISRAAEFGRTAVVRLLLEKGANIEKKDNFGRTAFWYAARSGQEEVVRFLLDNGVNVESEDKYNQTPLSEAAQRRQDAIVQLLLATERVNPDHKNKFGRTPLSYAAESGREAIGEIQDTIFENQDPEYKKKKLSKANEPGRKIAQLLLDTRCVDPDSKDANERTPLSYAAESGNDAVVQLLLATERVEPDHKDDEKRTPLAHAVASDHVSVVQLLLATKRVGLDHVDTFGYTPLSLASNKPELSRLLVKYRAEVLGITPIVIG
ncbi:hypothetical protein TWF281_011033 [Arthrobotrys megalospora]